MSKHIRIISPSGAIETTFIEGAKERLLSWGYRVSVAPHAFDRYGRFAGSDADRLQDISDAFSDPDVDVVLCSRGGYGLQRILPQVNTGKLLVGFSDITALHQKSDVATLHAIMCKHIATLPEDSMPIRYLRMALDDQPISYDLPSHPLNRQGKAEGMLIGGNLSVLYGLQGTEYAIAGKSLSSRPILFIEDIAERHYHIDRMMCNLKMSGVLAELGGLIVGQFSDCDDDATMGESVYQTIRRAVEDYDYPVLFDFPAGHVEQNLPLWLNKKAILHVSETKNTLAWI